MKFQIKISSHTNGISTTAHTKEQAMNIIDSLIGVDGIRRIILTWEQKQEQADNKPTEYHEQECAIVSHPEPNVTELLEAISNGQPKRFNELKATNEKSKGKYIDLQADQMGYNKLENGKIVIKRGTTKVRTTMEAMQRLPHPVPAELISHLSRPKQIAIKQFREWIYQGTPDKFIDPDEGFRPQLKQDTIPIGGGDFENKSGEYE